MSMQPDALLPALQVAVYLRLAELDRMSPWRRQQTIAKWASEAADVVAHRGDQLMFRTKPHKGEGGTADTFNHLARGLAALAHQPGGVDFLGQHWEEHSSDAQPRQEERGVQADPGPDR